MAQFKGGACAPVEIRYLQIQLTREETAEGTEYSAHYSIALLYDSGDAHSHHGDLVPVLSPAQIQHLKDDIDAAWALAEDQLGL